MYGRPVFTAPVKMSNVARCANSAMAFGQGIADLPFGGDVKNGTFYATLGMEFALGLK